MSRDEDDNANLTLGRAVRIVMAVCAVVGAVSAVAAAYYSLRESDRIAELRMCAIEKRLDQQDETIRDSQKAQQDLTRAVDKATVLMERIDKKMGQP